MYAIKQAHMIVGHFEYKNSSHVIGQPPNMNLIIRYFNVLLMSNFDEQKNIVLQFLIINRCANYVSSVPLRSYMRRKERLISTAIGRKRAWVNVWRKRRYRGRRKRVPLKNENKFSLYFFDLAAIQIPDLSICSKSTKLLRNLRQTRNLMNFWTLIRLVEG